MLGNLYLNGNLTLRLDFESRSKKLAATLQTQGIGQGDTVAVLMRNDVKYLEVIQACRYLGSYFVPLNWHSVTTEIEHILEDSGAKVLIAHKDLAHQLNEKNLPKVLLTTFPTPPEVAESYQIDVNARSSASDIALDLELALQELEEFRQVMSGFAHLWVCCLENCFQIFENGFQTHHLRTFCICLRTCHCSL